MDKRRLLKLADLLEANAKNKKGVKFDLETVARSRSLGKTMPLDCGTTACAMGLAAISGAFKRQGLSYYIVQPYGVNLTVHGDSMHYADVAMRMFDLTLHEAHYLFSPGHAPFKTYKGARAERLVAKRIRALVAGEDIIANGI
jgi:hypothetical protein